MSKTTVLSAGVNITGARLYTLTPGARTSLSATNGGCFGVAVARTQKKSYTGRNFFVDWKDGIVDTCTAAMR